MNFEFTDEQRAFRDEFREWLETTLPSGWIHGDWNLPEEKAERIEFLIDWQKTKYEDGWAAPSWPEEYGGMGASVVEELIYDDELARVNAPPNINGIGEQFVGPTLIELGTDAQKERFIPEILNCEEIWCQGYSEPEHGSDIAGLETVAELDGDEWVINGQKIWTSYGDIADWCLLMARTDSSGTKHEGITALIVDMNQEGVDVDEINQISGDSEFSQVFFDDARAPEAHVVGEVDEGWTVIRTMSAFEQTGSRAFDLQRRLNELLHFCRTTERGGRPLTDDPHVSRKLAEFDMRLQAARATRYRQVSERLDDPVPSPEGVIDTITSNDLAVDLENFAMTLRGPDATLWEDGPEDGRWVADYFESYGMWIAGGTGDIYRNIIGEQVLGLPKDEKSKYTHRRENADRDTE
ncbi:acyl-CoA dehydrogenase family protein [Natrarchaeobius sp. A-rgal3]|uniref:acyl-CoA dehydrogenase family protein n=1 Tax=Natrarchaeobius versutus TaxID=1679078 RepID=UPI0035108271